MDDFFLFFPLLSLLFLLFSLSLIGSLRFEEYCSVY